MQQTIQGNAVVTASKKKQRSQSSPSLYTLRVELIDIHPVIWRRIHVDGRVRLGALHHILQAAMGWSDAHLHQFEIRDKHYGVPDPEYDDLDCEMLDEKKSRLNQLLDVGDTGIYLYDFGDSWQHSLTVESIKDIGDRDPGVRGAWIEDGERACPPEDAGGAGQFQDFLELLENDPYGEETKRIQEWAGLDYDPARFDRLAANNAIARMLWNGWIKIGA